MSAQPVTPPKQISAHCSRCKQKTSVTPMFRQTRVQRISQPILVHCHRCNKTSLATPEKTVTNNIPITAPEVIQTIINAPPIVAHCSRCNQTLTVRPSFRPPKGQRIQNQIFAFCPRCHQNTLVDPIKTTAQLKKQISPQVKKETSAQVNTESTAPVDYQIVKLIKPKNDSYRVPVEFGPKPVAIHCPHCKFDGVTSIELVSGATMYKTIFGWCLLTLPCLLCCCGLIPLSMDTNYDVWHRCSKCGVVIAIYERPCC